MKKEKVKGVRNRSIKIPVAEVLEGGTKSEFYADLRSALDLSRRAANKTMQVCFSSDTDLQVQGAMPKLKVYSEVSKQFYGEFKNSTTALSAITNRVESKYREKRYEISKGRSSVPSYRSFPWPLKHNRSDKDIKVHAEGESIICEMKILQKKYKVKLAGAGRHRRQIHGIRSVIEQADRVIGVKKHRGKALDVNVGFGDSQIFLDKKHRAMLALAVRLPQEKTSETSGVFSVSTGRQSLFICSREGDRTPFSITGDQIFNWIKERDRKQQRLRVDNKSGAKRGRNHKKMQAISDKWRSRLDSFTHESTSQIIQHAIRRKSECVLLDMTVKAFMPSFPYFDFATKLKYKAEDAGLRFLEQTQTVKEPNADKPHVYFAYGEVTGRVKIGFTKKSFAERKEEGKALRSEPLVLLAVCNQPATKVAKKEAHFHAYFNEHWIKEKDIGKEWFHGEPVIQWLRDVQWLGNAGNLSQIAQCIDIGDYELPE